MERLTNKREAWAQRKDYENRIANGYPRNIPEERFLRLAAYEETGLMPEEIIDCRWIPVTERLPENGTPVLVNYIGNNDGKMHPDGVAVWTDYGCLWWEGSLEDCDTEVTVPITHWMPLPKAPEVE